jgi:hypothetical protein
MDFDEIVIGSGLAALGAVLGLEGRLRVLVLCGPMQGVFSYYDDQRMVPCAYLGEGGLGNDWHGVIPTGLNRNFANADEERFASLFARFYSHSEIRSRLGQPWLFVPWRPIRPRRELARIAAGRQDRLVLVRETAQRFRIGDAGVEVITASGTHRARRIWLAAGALHTPGLLERSLGRRFSRGVVSDHALLYVGQVHSAPAPKVAHTRDGMFFPAQYNPVGDALYTLRPARFAFRRLDYGIEQRAVFGLPTGSLLRKIARRGSPGLLAEAFYNRFGLFAAAGIHSVYAQVLVPDGYAMGDGTVPLTARLDAIRAATDAAREAQPFDGLRVSRRPELHIPGIHLHHSLDLEAVADAGINAPGAPVQVVDASVINDVGPDHPSFKMILAANEATRRASQ